MKNLAIRSVSGVVLGVVMLGAILWSQWSFGALLAVLTLAGMHEFYALCERRGEAPQRVLGLVAGVLLLALNFAFVSDDIRILGEAKSLFGCGMAFLLLLLPLMFVCELYRKRENPAANIAQTLLGVVYVAMPFALLCYVPLLASETWNPWVVVAYVAVIWANDVAAYLVGMSIGRRKLFERLSPKKSWEGFFGGLAGAVGAGFAAGHLLGGSPAAWAGLAAVAAVTAVAGDLAESMFKRAAGV
ncbi:MAG: phosphatidate cytidylyltransferase, partial [Alistipes sp.]|nr:phosphatidate cytidylyltransferase [Alistipes sp.]